jgi:uncharacterized membrane protein
MATSAAGLDEQGIARSVELATDTPARSEWRDFLATTLAMLGAGLVLAGVVCFVAFNWARIGRYGKFALLELAIVAAVLIAWKKRPALVGQMSLFAAAVLVGPLLAIYGQTYQTGADPYGLFLVWAGLITPWAILGRFAATWVLVILLLDTSILLFYTQVWTPVSTSHALLVPLSIATLHTAAVLVWEWQLHRTEPFFREDWAMRSVAASGLAALFIPWVAFIIGGSDAGLVGGIGAAIFALIVVVMLRYYAQKRPDRFMIALAGLGAMAGITIIAARVVFKWLEMGTFGAIVMAVFVLWQISFGLRLYRETHAS